jgi:hypothetical protein
LYEKIVACDPEYPDYFSEEVIDLLKHLLTPDLSRRYGNLKNGDLDIRGHPWFRSIDFDALASRTFKAPFVPMIKSEGDTSNFDVYDEQTQPYGQPGPDPYRKYFAEF